MQRWGGKVEQWLERPRPLGAAWIGGSGSCSTHGRFVTGPAPRLALGAGGRLALGCRCSPGARLGLDSCSRPDAPSLCLPSRIKGWWVFHHYISTFLSGVMLTW